MIMLSPFVTETMELLRVSLRLPSDVFRVDCSWAHRAQPVTSSREAELSRSQPAQPDHEPAQYAIVGFSVCRGSRPRSLTTRRRVVL